jgi:hypothetical protein
MFDVFLDRLLLHHRRHLLLAKCLRHFLVRIPRCRRWTILLLFFEVLQHYLLLRKQFRARFRFREVQSSGCCRMSAMSFSSISS